MPHWIAIKKNMRKQIYALVHDDVADSVLSHLVQPTGEYVEVNDNNGNPIMVEVSYGGDINISQMTGWNLYILGSTDVGFDEIRQLLISGFIEVATLIYADETWYLDSAPVDENSLLLMNTWLASQNMTQDSGSSKFSLVERVGQHFVPGFHVGDAYLG